jgi:hypothetical protein
MTQWDFQNINNNAIDELKEIGDITITCYEWEWEEQQGWIEGIRNDLEGYEYEYEYYPDEDYEGQGQVVLSAYEIEEEEEEEDDEGYSSSSDENEEE